MASLEMKYVVDKSDANTKTIQEFKDKIRIDPYYFLRIFIEFIYPPEDNFYTQLNSIKYIMDGNANLLAELTQTENAITLKRVKRL